jgi:hypothetical protein
MKGLSPIVSVVILVVISLSIASMVAPWMYNMVTQTANETGTTAQQQVRCRTAGLDFDTNYGYYGVLYNFSGNVSANETDWIKMKIVNTGTLDLHDFTVEATLLNNTDEIIEHYALTDASARTASNPLKSSQSAIITANITYDINETTTTLTEVKVLNSVCHELAPSIEI